MLGVWVIVMDVVSAGISLGRLYTMGTWLL